MSCVYFISDLHLGHTNILNFAGDYRDGSNSTEHDYILLERIKSTCNKRDTLYVCGDVVWDRSKDRQSTMLDMIAQIPSTKYLIRGNHDELPAKEYLRVFSDIFGILKYKSHWVSHAPIHPFELRGRPNIHGHVHQNSIKNVDGEYDKRYVNVCVEVSRGWPIKYQDILNGRYWSDKIT